MDDDQQGDPRNAASSFVRKLFEIVENEPDDIVAWFGGNLDILFDIII
jgi:hypothetical protein